MANHSVTGVADGVRNINLSRITSTLFIVLSDKCFLFRSLGCFVDRSSVRKIIFEGLQKFFWGGQETLTNVLQLNCQTLDFTLEWIKGSVCFLTKTLANKNLNRELISQCQSFHFRRTHKSLGGFFNSGFSNALQNISLMGTFQKAFMFAFVDLCFKF